MEIIRDIDRIMEDSAGAVIMMIGDFGGIHLVHQAIFKKIVKEASGGNRKALVIITPATIYVKVVIPPAMAFVGVTGPNYCESRGGIKEASKLGVFSFFVIPAEAGIQVFYRNPGEIRRSFVIPAESGCLISSFRA